MFGGSFKLKTRISILAVNAMVNKNVYAAKKIIP